MAYPSEGAAAEVIDAVQGSTKARLVAHGAVSVMVYSDGSAETRFTRLDVPACRIISHALTEQRVLNPTRLAIASCLIAAADEHYIDVGGVPQYDR